MWRSEPAAGGKVAGLPRAYGEAPGTIRDPAAPPPALARKTRAWGESPIRGDVPDVLRDVIDGMDVPAGRAVFRVLARASTESGFDAAVRAAGHLASAGRAIGAASVDVMARRIARGDTPADAAAPDLGVYDKFNRPQAVHGANGGTA